MRDVLPRLMEWMETSDIDDAHIVLRDAITEIVRLRAQVETARVTLTDDERQSIRWIVGDDLSADGVNIQATLRGLLERHDRIGHR